MQLLVLLPLMGVFDECATAEFTAAAEALLTMGRGRAGGFSLLFVEMCLKLRARGGRQTMRLPRN